MQLLYSFSIAIAKVLAPLFATSSKGKAFVTGRKKVWDQLEYIPKVKKVIWMHCASLGEYEQGLPVFKELKATYPEYFYLVTFFSPSGYEVRKNHGIADLVTYLPWDTKADVKRFISIVNPKLALMVKYEFWPNLISEIHHRKIPIFLIAGLFRRKQTFFKPWGTSYRKLLQGYSHIFVQNEQSQKLLATIDIEQFSISGDTRYDRVGQKKEPLSFMNTFVGNRKCIIAGSTWPEDEAVLLDAIAKTPSDWCWLIAPHELHDEKIKKLMGKLPHGSLRYTQSKASEFGICPVLVLDTVGMLSQCYTSGHIAYVGGAMGTSGLHNILEPAAEGIPVIIGKNHHKFPGAKALIDLGGVISISTAKECTQVLLALMQNEALRQEKGTTNRTFITQNQGATQHTLKLIKNYL